MKIKNKNVVVIGASGGIGRVLSLGFTLEGARVVLVGRKKGVLLALEKKIKEINPKCFILTADISQKASIDKMVRILGKKIKSIDILVHTAGIGVYKPLKEIEWDEWVLQTRVNVDSVFYVTKKCLPLLKKSKRAYVVAMGSGMGKVGVAGRSAYCTSKFALRGLMLSLAKEYKHTNINFSLMTLGSVMTGFGPLTLEEKREKQSRGKKYLNPPKLAHNIISKIKNDTLEEENSLYPSNYFGESVKGKV